MRQSEMQSEQIRYIESAEKARSRFPRTKFVPAHAIYEVSNEVLLLLCGLAFKSDEQQFVCLILMHTERVHFLANIIDFCLVRSDTFAGKGYIRIIGLHLLSEVKVTWNERMIHCKLQKKKGH